MNELVVTDEATKQLAIITDVQQGLTDLETECSVVLDLSTEDGLAEAKVRLRKLAKARNAVEKARLAHNKAKRDIVAEEIDACDDLAKEQIQPVIAKYEVPLKKQVTDIEQAEERRKQAEEEAEAARVAKIQQGLADITNAPLRAVTIEHCSEAIQWLQSIDLSCFDEHAGSAAKLAGESLEALRERRELLQKQADDAAELAAQKAEQDRVAEKQRAEQEAFEKEKSEFEAEKAADQKKKDDAAKAEAEKAEAIEAARVAKIEAAIAHIQQAASRCLTIEDVNAELLALEQIDFDQFEEFDASAVQWRAQSVDELNLMKTEILEKAEALEQQRKAEIAAAAEKAAQAERDRIAAEKQRQDDEQAERERIAAMAPDADKLRVWMRAFPDVSTDEGRAAILAIGEAGETIISRMASQQVAA